MHSRNLFSDPSKPEFFRIFTQNYWFDFENIHSNIWFGFENIYSNIWFRFEIIYSYSWFDFEKQNHCAA